MIFFIVWILGSLLSIPRIIAQFYELDEEWQYAKPSNYVFAVFISLAFSWIAVMVGILFYFMNEEKYFWKWSNKDLRKRYLKYKNN